MEKVTTVILTGGLAKRMRPLSENTCKSMLPFLGKPLLYYLVRDLSSQGFDDIIFTSPGRKGEIRDYFSDGSAFGISIRYPDVNSWRGTGGALADALAADKREHNYPLMVVYGDSLIRADYAGLVKFHHQMKTSATILSHTPNLQAFQYEYHDEAYPDLGPRTNFGVMDVAANGRVVRFEEKPLFTDIESYFKVPAANATAYILGKEALECIPKNGNYGFVENMFPMLAERGACNCFSVGDGYRFDIGTLQLYYSIQIAALRGLFAFQSDLPNIGTLSEPVLIGNNVDIHASAQIECSIIGSGSSVGAGSSITNSILFDGVQVAENIAIRDSIVSQNVVINDTHKIPCQSIIAVGEILTTDRLWIGYETLDGLLGRQGGCQHACE